SGVVIVRLNNCDSSFSVCCGCVFSSSDPSALLSAFIFLLLCFSSMLFALSCVLFLNTTLTFLCFFCLITHSTSVSAQETLIIPLTLICYCFSTLGFTAASPGSPCPLYSVFILLSTKF
ncbi:unnamed protein product, partial [Meganyctiphanes norvegica]